MPCGSVWKSMPKVARQEEPFLGIKKGLIRAKTVLQALVFVLEAVFHVTQFGSRNPVH